MKRSLYLLGTFLLATIFFSGFNQAQAVKLRDGKTYFVGVPRLIDTYSTINYTYARGANYYFQLEVPQNSGEPLQRVLIQQFQSFDDIGFITEESGAFIKGTDQKIATVSKDKNGQSVSVVFDPPIVPGQNIIIKLRPLSNPRIGGAYLFGITAFPQGEDPHGQFLGYGRIHFYDAYEN